MYNLKVYDKVGNFIQTLNDKEISCDLSFSASVNGGLTTLKFEYYGDYQFDHKQRIKVYKGTKSIYQGFITSITKKADKSGKRQIVKTSGLLGLLSFEICDYSSVNSNPSTLLRGVFSSIDGIDVSGISIYPESISFTTQAKDLLSFLQEILKNVKDYALFLDADNKVWFKPYDTLHVLTYNLDCYNIELAEDSSNYYNRILLTYDGGDYLGVDSEGVQRYGANDLEINDSSIKNYTTAILRVNSLLDEKSIQRSYKVSVNGNYDYYSIKPGDLVSVRNTDWIIENKPVKQVQYSKNTAVISLDSYKPIESFIINQKYVQC